MGHNGRRRASLDFGLQLMSALQRNRRLLPSSAVVAPGLLELEEMAAYWITEGQAGSVFDKPCSCRDGGQVRPKLLTIPEAATVLNVSEPTVKRLIAAGRFPKVRIGPRVVRIRVADIDRYIDSLIAD